MEQGLVLLSPPPPPPPLSVPLRLPISLLSIPLCLFRSVCLSISHSSSDSTACSRFLDICILVRLLGGKMDRRVLVALFMLKAPGLNPCDEVVYGNVP